MSHLGQVPVLNIFHNFLSNIQENDIEHCGLHSLAFYKQIKLKFHHPLFKHIYGKVPKVLTVVALCDMSKMIPHFFKLI